MTGIAYRAPVMADLEALAALGRETFIATFGPLYADADLAHFLDQVWGRDGLPKDFASGDYDYRIAETGGRMIGFVKLGKPYIKLPPHLAGDGRRKIELCQLYIRKEWQGEGVAAALMDWAMARARILGADDVYLSVYNENIRAQRFYARYGFSEVGRHIFMVGDHEDDDRIWRARLDG